MTIDLLSCDTPPAGLLAPEKSEGMLCAGAEHAWVCPCTKDPATISYVDHSLSGIYVKAHQNAFRASQQIVHPVWNEGQRTGFAPCDCADLKHLPGCLNGIGVLASENPVCELLQWYSRRNTVLLRQACVVDGFYRLIPVLK